MAGVEQPRWSQCSADDYSQLKDLKIPLDRGGVGGGEEGSGVGGFSICFWMYLTSLGKPYPVILKQMSSESMHEVPFLALNEENKLMLLPLLSVHEEAPDDSTLRPDMPHTAADIDCPLDKWIHVGCQVATNYMRLHVDGKLVGEMLFCSLTREQSQDNLHKLTLVGNNENVGGYVYHVQVLLLSESIRDNHFKKPPVKLSLDSKCICDGVEEGADGVWSVVGGKASCRRNFSLEVMLLDAFGRSVHREMEVVASLLYADSGACVEKTRDDSEAPLLMSCDGLEYPSTDRPVMLLRGRAAFKLKISQLSSKCDNRLFRVCFYTLHGERYPFLEAFSHPIRCISRNRTNRTLGFGKRLTSAPLLDETQQIKCNDANAICDTYANGPAQERNQSLLKNIPPSKCPKVDQGLLADTVSNGITKQALKTSLEVRSAYSEGTDCVPSDSEGTDAEDSESKNQESVSDAVLFRYCIGGTHERAVLLREMIASTSDEDMKKFAEQVCLYTGCSHHRRQILFSRLLFDEVADAWNLIAKDKQRVPWAEAVPEIIRRFMIIAQSSSRTLSGQDLQVLQGIAGCGDGLSRTEFERMWYWLFPVAFALSTDQMKRIWQSSTEKWIEGFITKEEAETALKGPGGRREKAGTFVLRFPTSRSWPHPDAGSLVVTYVGTDFLVHHKLLSLDYRDLSSKMLQEMLLEEPELSQLGRVERY